MKTAMQIVNESLEHGITLLIMNGKLQYETNRGSIPSELFNEWINNKNQLMSFLAQSYPKENMSQDNILDNKFYYSEKKLVSISPMHHFPLDNPRSEKQNFEKRTHQQRISNNIIQDIKMLCTQHEVTLFTFLETAFAVLLSHYSNEKDIVIETLITKRKRYDIESLIGSFVDSLVIRTDLSAQPTFSELLKQNNHAILDAYAHQALPFERLAKKITPNHNLNYHPIFQIAFTLGNTNQQNMALEQENHIKSEEYLHLKTLLDLEIHIYEEDGEELSLLWNYDIDLFESATIERLSANYETLLSNIVAMMTQGVDEVLPGQVSSVHNIPFLSDTEKHTLLHEWNGPQKHYQTGRCFHELFEEQAERMPENTALIFGNDSLSYRAVNEQANQLAHYLIELGVKPDTLVALCIPRSLQGMVALLGIIKAGGAYVPLDPGYPQARLQYMLEHSEVEFILTETHLAEKLSISQQTVIYLDTQIVQLHLQNMPTGNITKRSTPLTEDHLIYVIYTSGSTGKPKGVMVKHKGWVNLALSQADLFGIDANSRVLQFASWSFVAMTIEMAMAFPCGATLCLISETQQRTPELLDDVVEKYQITHTMLPQALLPHLNFNKWQSVSTLLLGGEAVPPQIATRWKLGRKLFNAYGSTETSSMVTAGLLIDDRITIGKPLPNIVVRILDPEGNLVPIGAIGELHIGGVQLARGYRNSPEITEKQFIRDPLSSSCADSDTENRLYRTGDLVRWTPDGQLEFIGRVDSLVKIRGYRIELGEIEDTLSGHDALSSAAVIAYGESNEDKRLIAYVCPSAEWLGERGAAFDASALGSELSELLQSFLNQQLPEYMVPRIYILLERMPLTPNNKVDKKALPVPDNSKLRQQNYVAPRDEIEEKLCLLWQKHLKINQVGIHDNFFALGGYSLLATKITASVKNILNNSLSMYQLFTNPTVAQIANVIKDTKRPEISISESIQNTPDGKIPLSYGHKLLLPLIQKGRIEQCFHVPVALLINGIPDRNALEKSLNTLLERHESLRLKFYQENEQIFVKPDNNMTIDLQIVNLQPEGIGKEKILSEIERFWQEEQKIPFDIYNKPLIRAFLLPISETSTGLLFDIHHIIFDGWSINIFLNELAQLYTAYSQGQEPILPPVAMKYSDYIYDSQRSHKTDEYQTQLKFWQQQFSNVSMQHNFLVDFSRNIASNGHFNIHYINIPNSVTNAFSKYCEANNTTPYMLFMALFHTCIFMYSGVSQTITASPRIERTSIESQQAIGLFLNGLLVKSSINKEMSLHDIIQQIRQFIYDAMQNLDVHVSLVIDSVGEKVRDALFNIVFNYMDIEDDEEEFFDNLDIESIQIVPTPFESLGMTFFNKPKSIICEFTYNPELYSKEAIDSLLRYYERLMNAIVSGQEKESIRNFYD
ncbi:non-ribosomal peptide synthetase [Xenorhabdus lircayensis]|uniref:Amino acid adenylation domain-containing protein n=1 Tax=Xenorhabdus lircayensis TaxID=2763499 RepID=A0ABS0UA18_9GAMM|nr:non-ribosomal peptide synthetase [Xenorhabdus lircayensis]MBI6550737.1 amino acid adenylation domain-containing protein [Xenorhabdus lircayensis]